MAAALQQQQQLQPQHQHAAPHLNGGSHPASEAATTGQGETEGALGQVVPSAAAGMTPAAAPDGPPASAPDGVLNQKGLLLSDGLAGQDYFERPENETLAGLSTYDLVPRDYVLPHAEKQKLAPEERLALGMQPQQEPPAPQDLMYHLRLDLNSLYEKAQEAYEDNASVSSADSDEIAAHELEWPDVDPNISASDQLRLDFPFSIDSEPSEMRRSLFTAFVDEFAEVYANQAPHLAQHLDLAQNINAEIASLKLKMLHILAQHTDASDEVTTEGLLEPLQHRLNAYARRLQALSLYQMDLLLGAKRVADAAAQRFHAELVIASQADPAIVAQEAFKYQQVIAPMPRPKPARSTLPGTLSKERRDRQAAPDAPETADGEGAPGTADGEDGDDAAPDVVDGEDGDDVADGEDDEDGDDAAADADPDAADADSATSEDEAQPSSAATPTPPPDTNGRRRSTRSATAEATPSPAPPPAPAQNDQERPKPKVSLVIKPPKPQTPSPAPAPAAPAGRRTRASAPEPEGDKGGQGDQGDQELFCICRKPDTHGTMVGCENDDCPIGWYHTDCLGLKSVPTGEWYCPTCTDKSRKRRRR